MAIKFNSEIGPASILGIIQIVVGVVGAGYYFGQQKSGGDASQKTIEKIETSDNRQAAQIGDMATQLAVMKETLITIKDDIRDIKQRQIGDIYRKPQ